MTVKQKTEPEELPVLEQMAGFPLKPGQMLLLGPLSVAYIKGDYVKAPWLMPHVRAPGGRRLPDMYTLEKHEWQAKEE